MCSCGRNPLVAVCSECPPGATGARGQSIGVRISDEGSGVNCLYGGYKIEVGIDTDLDGLPETVLNTKYLCNAAPGTDGSAVTFVTGTITTLAAGSSVTAAVVPTATPNQYQIDLGLPVGADGSTPTLITGTITTVAAGSPATASIVATGTPNQYQINMGIPIGATGATPAASAFVINGLTIPSCFSGVVNNGDSLQAFIQAMLNSICSLASGSLAAGTFKAVKTSLQSVLLDVVTTVYDLITEDDTTPGQYDNGNNFIGSRYTTPSGGITKTFVLENVKLKNPGSNPWTAASGGTVTLQIVKKVGATITVLASATPITYTLVDAYGGTVNTPSGYTAQPITTGAITLGAGDLVYARIATACTGVNERVDVQTQARLSNY